MVHILGSLVIVLPVRVAALDLRNFDLPNSSGTCSVKGEGHSRLVRSRVTQINVNWKKQKASKSIFIC